MKNAQEILQFSGYPLEPLVALQIKKTFDALLVEKSRPQSPHIKLLGSSNATNSLQWDLAWFGNYE